MHMAQLLDHLFASVDVEVIKARLKEMTLLLLSIFSPQAKLILDLVSRRQQTLTYPLL